MTLSENTERIRELEYAGFETELTNEIISELNDLWLKREMLLTHSNQEYLRGYASGKAEGYRLMLLNKGV
jgi:hypothetical protein